MITSTNSTSLATWKKYLSGLQTILTNCLAGFKENNYKMLLLTGQHLRNTCQDTWHFITLASLANDSFVRSSLHPRQMPLETRTGTFDALKISLKQLKLWKLLTKPWIGPLHRLTTSEIHISSDALVRVTTWLFLSARLLRVSDDLRTIFSDRWFSCIPKSKTDKNLP